MAAGLRVEWLYIWTYLDSVLHIHSVYIANQLLYHRRESHELRLTVLWHQMFLLSVCLIARRDQWARRITIDIRTVHLHLETGLRVRG